MVSHFHFAPNARAHRRRFRGVICAPSLSSEIMPRNCRTVGRVVGEFNPIPVLVLRRSQASIAVALFGLLGAGQPFDLARRFAPRPRNITCQPAPFIRLLRMVPVGSIWFPNVAAEPQLAPPRGKL